MSSAPLDAALIEAYSKFCKSICQTSGKSLSESEVTAEIQKEPNFSKISNPPIFLLALMESLTKECEILLLDPRETSASLRRQYPIEVFEVAQVRVLFRSPASPHGTSSPSNMNTSTIPLNLSHSGPVNPMTLAGNQPANVASYHMPQVTPANPTSNSSYSLHHSSAFPSHMSPARSNDTSKNYPNLSHSTEASSPFLSPLSSLSTVKPVAPSPYLSAAPAQAQGIQKPVPALHPHYTSTLQPSTSGNSHLTNHSSGISGPPR